MKLFNFGTKNKGKVYYDKAQELFKENKTKEGYEMIEKSAEEGYSEAQFQLATSIFEMKRNLPISEGIKWLEKAAEQNHIFAINNLAMCYQTGNGVAINYAKALQLLEQAASLGDMMAYYNIGQSYIFGLGVKKDFLKGISYVKRAADSNVEGCEHAQNMLGQIYEGGYHDEDIDIESDINIAIQWYKKAFEKKDPEAKKALIRLDVIEGEVDKEKLARNFMSIWLHYDMSPINHIMDVNLKYSSYNIASEGKSDSINFKDRDLKYFEKETKEALTTILENKYELRARLRDNGRGDFICDTIQNGTMVSFELLASNSKIMRINKFIIEG